MKIADAKEVLSKFSPLSSMGKVKNVTGIMIEVTGIKAKVGDICTIYGADDEKTITSEVVGFKDENVLLMSYGDMKGISPGAFVQTTGSQLRVPVGDFLIGRTVDATGYPMDGKVTLLMYINFMMLKESRQILWKEFAYLNKCHTVLKQLTA